MADSYPPGTIYDLKKFADKILNSDLWIHLRVTLDRGTPFTYFVATGAEERDILSAVPAPLPAGQSATTTANLRARDLPKLTGSIILKVLDKGQQVILGDSAPVPEAASGITWRFIIWPLRAWVSQEYLAFAVVQPPPIPTLTGRMGLCVVSSGDGNDQRQLEAVVTGLRNQGKTLASAVVVQDANIANWGIGNSPETAWCFRHIPMISDINGTHEITPGELNYDARAMWDRCWPELSKVPHARWYQVDNESAPGDIVSFRKWCLYQSTLIDIAEAHPAKPKLALFNFGTGQPPYENPEFKAALDPVLRKAALAGMVGDVHCYSPTERDDPSGLTDIEASWEWFAGRIFRIMDAVPELPWICNEWGLAWGKYPGRELYQGNVGKFLRRIQAYPRFLCFNSWMIPERPGDGVVWKWQGHGVPVADFIEIAQ